MVDSMFDAATDLGTPLMLKSRRSAYNGWGNAVLCAAADALVAAVLRELFGKKSLCQSRLIPTCSTRRSGSSTSAML